MMTYHVLSVCLLTVAFLVAPAKSDQDFSYFQNVTELISVFPLVLSRLPLNECTVQLMYFINAWPKGETWAIKMLDAIAKPQAGILFGNSMHVGNYDECLKMDAKIGKTEIQGKYCTAIFQAHPQFGGEFNKLLEVLTGHVTRNDDENKIVDNARLSYGFCVPKVCSVEDLQNLTNIMENEVVSPFHFKFSNEYCDDGESKKLTTSAIVAIIIFSMFAALLFFGTLYDVVVYSKLCVGNQKPNFLVAFSLTRNGRKLFSTSSTEGNLDCLNGLRVISMMWILLAHGYQASFFTPLVNTLEILTWKDDAKNAFFQAAAVGVDTFFVISGLLVVYVSMKNNAQGKKFSLPMFWLHRIIRLTPSLAMVVLFTTTLITYMGHGPFWPAVDEMYQKPCERNWWATLIYLQNYIHSDDLCVGQAWYLAVDTQMYFLSPLIFFSMIKWPKMIITAIFVFTVLNCSYVFEITRKKHLGTTFLNEDDTQYKYIYSPTHIRGVAYLIGMVCGYLLYKTKNEITLKLSKRKVMGLWIVSLGVMVGIVFAHHAMMAAPEYDTLKSSIFNSLTRVGWSIALSLLIILCVNDYGGPINSILSNKIFTFLYRINYSVYLLHLNVIILFYAQKRSPGYFSNLFGLHEFWGNYVCTVATAVVWTLAFESPVIMIEKIIFRTGKHTNLVKNKVDDNGTVVLQIANNLNCIINK